jgi:ferredoxin-fold anticodon binding domain-containing protein
MKKEFLSKMKYYLLEHNLNEAIGRKILYQNVNYVIFKKNVENKSLLMKKDGKNKSVVIQVVQVVLISQK